ncbi:hypothetical protein B0H13DRAFT_2668977 [Mycena leptocephala]|nr:hypothetical protein B0H13DRAFT_2668977 [Mycena leptocephala]
MNELLANEHGNWNLAFGTRPLPTTRKPCLRHLRQEASFFEEPFMHDSDAASPVTACVVIPRLRSRLRLLSWSSPCIVTGAVSDPTHVALALARTPSPPISPSRRRGYVLPLAPVPLHPCLRLRPRRPPCVSLVVTTRAVVVAVPDLHHGTRTHTQKSPRSPHRSLRPVVSLLARGARWRLAIPSLLRPAAGRTACAILRAGILRSILVAPAYITYSPHHPICSLLSLITGRTTCGISSNSPLPCHDKARLCRPGDDEGFASALPKTRCHERVDPQLEAHRSLLAASRYRPPYRFCLRLALSLQCERAARRYWCDDGSRFACFPLSACVHTLAPCAARPVFISACHCLRRCCAARGPARAPPALAASRRIVFVSVGVRRGSRFALRALVPSHRFMPSRGTRPRCPCTARPLFVSATVLASGDGTGGSSSPPPHARSLALSHLASGHSGVCGLAAHVPIMDGNVEMGAAGATMDLDSLIPPSAHLAPSNPRTGVMEESRSRCPLPAYRVEPVWMWRCALREETALRVR